jgi:MscS family membrane protein
MTSAKLVTALLFSFIGACAQILPSSGQTSNGQPASSPVQSKDPLGRDTPQSSVVAFLEASHAQNYALAWRYLDLRQVPESQRLTDGTALAQELQQVLDRDTRFDVANLSRNPEGDLSDNLAPNRELVDTFQVSGRALRIELQRITLGSGQPVWLFSSDSLANIPLIARTASKSVIERRLPAPLVQLQLIGTPLWRWIGLILLALVLAAISGWVSQVVLWIVKLAARGRPVAGSLANLRALLGPLRLLVSVLLFRAGMGWLGPSALLRLYLGRLLALLFFCGVFGLGAVIIDLMVRRLRVRLEARHRTFSFSVLPLIGRVAKIVVLLLIIAGILGEWGYNTTTLLAGLGIGGIAIALASQKTIENLFGSVSVISDRPVSVGDFCKFGGQVGTVEDIGLRSTRIRTLDRTLVTVPNASFSAMTLENFAMRDKILFHVTLNLRRNTTPDQLRDLLRSITKLLIDHTKVETGPIPVRFVGIGTYSLDLEVFVYIGTPDFNEFLKIQQDLLLAIMDAVESSGTALALPTQTTFTYLNQPAPITNGPVSPQPVPANVVKK